jgi:hypothetical protein
VQGKLPARFGRGGRETYPEGQRAPPLPYEKKRAPREVKAQALHAFLPGQSAGQRGEEWLRLLIRRAPGRILPEAGEEEQAGVLGRGRYEARGEQVGERKGYENGTRKTGEGVLRVQLPQMRGRTQP